MVSEPRETAFVWNEGCDQTLVVKVLNVVMKLDTSRTQRAQFGQAGVR